MSIVIIEFTQTLNKKNEAVDWVLYGPKDDMNTRTKVRVKELIPLDTLEEGSTKRMHMDWMWDQVKPAYDAWKSGAELPETGTPLGAWPALTKQQVKAFHLAGVKSIEDVRDLPESMMGRVHLPNLRGLIKQAGMFLENQDKNSMVQDKLEQDEKISSLTEQLEAAMALLEEKKPKAKSKEAA